MDDFVLWLLSFQIIIIQFLLFLPQTPNKNFWRRGRKTKRGGGFERLKSGGPAPSRDVFRRKSLFTSSRETKKKELLRTPPPPLFKQLHFSTPRISAQLKRTPQKKKSRVIINAVVFARVVQTVLSAVSLYRLLALRYSSREKKPIVLVEKKYTSIC